MGLLHRALRDCGWDDVLSRDLGEELLRRLSAGEEDPAQAGERWHQLALRFSRFKPFRVTVGIEIAA